jgi:hypothetical protein
MSNNDASDTVAPDEQLSRYILQHNHIRKSDNTIKQDAFIPHPHEDLSVTRHLDLDQEAIWSIGEEVARQTGKNLYGRAENLAATYLDQKLIVSPAPLTGNPNHANVSGWPADKPMQKIIAIEIAAKSRYVPHEG